MSGETHVGRCACGAVRYRAEGPLRPVIACHCETCRRTSGHHVAATAAARETLSVEGDVRWYRSSDTARRGFCPVCGSNLFWDGSGETISIFAGTLDQPTGLRVAAHIFCAEKGDYYGIPEEVPQASGAWSS